MSFPFHIDILSLIFKGILIGIIASAPMGPVGILCVQRTLNKGRWYGFVTGIGAAVSDMIYALITGLEMSFVMDLIKNPHNSFVLQITASIILLIFGVVCAVHFCHSRPQIRDEHRLHGDCLRRIAVVVWADLAGG